MLGVGCGKDVTSIDGLEFPGDVTPFLGPKVMRVVSRSILDGRKTVNIMTKRKNGIRLNKSFGKFSRLIGSLPNAGTWLRSCGSLTSGRRRITGGGTITAA